MADPRTFTVKQCEPSYADKSGAAIAASSTSRRDFFNAVGKIGDLSVLNSVGGGKIGSGLRNLASISNTIRIGTGALPSSIGTSLDTGANWVLGQTGIAPTVVSAVAGFNPGIANQAFAQAKNVFSAVKGGTFKSTDIPGALQDFQNLERLGRNIFTPGAGDVQTSLGEHCDASPYAVDLVSRAPKYKFLFLVQFVPNPGYEQMLDISSGMVFVVKKSTRPNIKFHYDDVNYYNYRTKVITKSEFEEMSMSFHDDTLNYAGRFYHAYMRYISPITGLVGPATNADLLKEGGMDFKGHTLDRSGLASSYAASSGTLVNDNKDVFKEIRLFHLHDNGNEMNVFRFQNPKITSMQLDEVDMSAGTEGSELSIQFTFDSMYMDVNVSLATDKTYNIADLQRGAVYPLRYNGQAGPGGTLSTSTLSASTSAAGLLSPLNNLTAGVSSAGNAAVAAVGDLSTKFSQALSSLPFGLG